MRPKSKAIVTAAIIAAAFCIFMEQHSPATAEEKQQAEATSPLGEITNSIGMKFRLIHAGSFMMGASPGDSEARDDEKPQHRVEITGQFYMGVHEVTQAQYESVIGTNPSSFKGSTRPVEQVSWTDAVEFCRRLSAREGATYRLPTEAEWEYACRAGTTTRYYWGDEMDDDYGWHTNNSGFETHPVGLKHSNAWDLYDISGNVWEWCQDWYDKDYYSISSSRDPAGSSSGEYRVLRGGGWGSFTRYFRSASRNWGTPSGRSDYYGFRCVRDAN